LTCEGDFKFLILKVLNPKSGFEVSHVLTKCVVLRLVEFCLLLVGFNEVFNSILSILGQLKLGGDFLVIFHQSIVFDL